jgi:tetratricopeptide (TPR) repeat protein
MEIRTYLDVFVSSSMSEFPAERAMLREIIPTFSKGTVTLRAWVYEEDAYASPASIQKLYTERLHTAELYIGIFGIKGGAYTLDEFNIATVYAIPRLIFVRNLKEGEKRDEPLTDFLRRIGDVEYGLAPFYFDDLDDLKAAVSRSLAHWVETRLLRRAGTISATLATHPGMLQDLPKKLIGREDLIGKINPLLNEGETVLLQGFGGMGKTALAATLAAEWINGRLVLWQGLGTETPEALFEAIARPFNAQQAMAAARDDQKSILTKQLLLEAKVSLVVLDDAWDGESLKAVLQGLPKTIPVLVTSHHRYPVGKIIRVDEFSPEKALEVLEYYAGTPCRNDPKAGELCKLLGYHAFALEVAGRTMQSADLTPSELYQRIHDHPFDIQVPAEFSQEGRRTVADLLNASLTLLDNETRSVFMAIGAFFDTRIAPELLTLYFMPDVTAANVVTTAIEHALESLSLRGLAEKLKANERGVTHYRLHDLAFSYAQASHQEESRYRALDACLLYTELHNRPSLANFAALRPLVKTLLNAADWAMSRGLYGQVERFAWNLYAQGSEILDYDGLYTQAIHLLEGAAQAAHKAGSRRNQGAHLGNLGNAYYGLGQYQQAIKYYQQALTISHEIGDRQGEGNCLGNLGSVYMDLGQTEQAVQYHQQALSISREIGDRRAEGQDLGNLGSAYRSLGQFQQAIDHYQQALSISREIGDRRGEGSRLGNLGSIYADLGQFQQAIEYHQQALTIRREIGDRRGEGNDLGNLGVTYTALGHHEQAISYHQQALTISREIGDRMGESNHLNNIGVLYEVQGDALIQAGKAAEAQANYRIALDFYQQARAIYTAIGAPHLVQHVDRNIADLQRKLSNRG